MQVRGTRGAALEIIRPGNAVGERPVVVSRPSPTMITEPEIAMDKVLNQVNINPSVTCGASLHPVTILSLPLCPSNTKIEGRVTHLTSVESMQYNNEASIQLTSM